MRKFFKSPEEYSLLLIMNYHYSSFGKGGGGGGGGGGEFKLKYCNSLKDKISLKIRIIFLSYFNLHVTQKNEQVKLH